jgi:uncharacterized iron-regulated membrane protein
MNFRILHRKIAPFIFVPLLLSATTGVAYRVGRSWFGLSDGFGEIMMTIHQGEFLGEPLSPVYVLLTGLGLVAAIVSGVNMLLKMRARKNTARPAEQTPRSLHRWLAPVFFLPLFVSATTGIIYSFGRSLGLSTEQTQLMLRLHQGSYLGQPLRVFYVLLVGVGLLGLLVTGIQMTGIFRKRTTT